MIVLLVPKNVNIFYIEYLGFCRGAGDHSSILTVWNLFKVSVPFNHIFKCIILTFEENAFGEFGGLSPRRSACARDFLEPAEESNMTATKCSYLESYNKKSLLNCNVSQFPYDTHIFMNGNQIRHSRLKL